MYIVADVENLSGVSYCASLARSEAMFADLGHLVCLCMASRNEVVKRVPWWVRWVGSKWGLFCTTHATLG
ncbi:hypothetical protein Hanom_Chr10g00874681 [Helianthus anomalus]